MSEASAKQRAELDAQLDTATWAYEAELARQDAARLQAGQAVARTKSPPSWWKGEAEAEQVTSVLGARIQVVKPRA